MAFTLEAITAASTVTLSDGNPYKLESAVGLGMSPLHRLTERGPVQDGVTDLGVRLDPRTVTLAVNYVGTSAADLDTNRDTLMATFKPTASTLVQLKLTRDDGAVRQLDCYTVAADVPLDYRQQPGNLNRVAIQLRAADPLWYDPTSVATNFAVSAEWWLGGGAITEESTQGHVDDPAVNESFPDFVEFGGKWTTVIRSIGNSSAKYTVAGDRTEWNYSGGHILDFVSNTNKKYTAVSSDTFMLAAATNYYIQSTTDSGSAWEIYRGTTLYDSGFASEAGTGFTPYLYGSATGLQFKDDDITHAAFYGESLTAAQRAALEITMSATSGTSTTSSIAYAGDFREYPVIRIIGAITDPVVTNTSTNEKLDFTGTTIGAGDWYDIDTRYGNKTVKDSGGTSRIGNLTSDSNLATFHLAAGPEVSGGTNTLSLAGSVGGTQSPVATVTHYNRYTSF